LYKSERGKEAEIGHESSNGEPFHGFSISNSSFVCNGCVSILSLLDRDHEPPPAFPINRQFAAVKDIPGSLAKMYVPIRLNPRLNAALAEAP
jgi:hypothetical protein